MARVTGKVTARVTGKVTGKVAGKVKATGVKPGRMTRTGRVTHSMQHPMMLN
jgi:hypothetical protein